MRFDNRDGTFSMIRVMFDERRRFAINAIYILPQNVAAPILFSI